MNLLKGHHCWVLRAFTSAFAHRRACRRSHEYSGDPFDPRRLLTVALYDNCSSQIALSSAVREAAFGTKLTARPGTRRPVDASDQSSGQHPAPKRKLASTRRRPTRISNRAHAPPEKFDYSRAVHTSQRTSCTRPRHKSRRVRRPAQRQLESLQQQLHRFGTTRARPRRAPYNASAPP